MNLPFGFDGFGGAQFPRMRAPMSDAPADPAPTEKKVKPWWKQTVGNIKWAAKHGGTSSPLLPLAALLGIPMNQKRRGEWMTINPGMRAIYPMGTTPFGFGGYGGFGGGGGGGGDDGGGDGGGDNGGGDTNGDGYNDLLNLLYPPPIGSGAQWRNTMKYGA